MSHGARIPDDVICDSKGVPYFSSGEIGSNDEYEPHPYLVGYSVDPAKIIQAKVVGAALSAEIELDHLVIDASDPDVPSDYGGRARHGQMRVLLTTGYAAYQFYNDWSSLQFRVNAEDSAPAVYCDGEVFLLDCKESVIRGAYAVGECARGGAFDAASSWVTETDSEDMDDVFIPASEFKPALVDIVRALGMEMPEIVPAPAA